MSTAQRSFTPVFSSEVDESQLNKPVSKLALAAFVLGLLGLLAPLTNLFFPFALGAAILGIAGSITLGSKSSSQGGTLLANVGMFLGIASAIWSGLAAKNARDNTAAHASDFAAYYLEILADGEVYKATELHLPAGGRQLPGLSLNDYYESYSGSISDDALKGATGGSPDPRAVAKRRMVDLRESEPAKYAAKYPNATWKFVALKDEIYLRGNLKRINVLMSNSEVPTDKIEVVLERQEYQDDKGKLIAEWYVKDTKLVR